MNLFLRCLVIAQLSFACAGGASAQSVSSVGGSVFDQSKEAIAGALVKAVNQVSGRVVTAKTDSAGRYKISGLRAGEYRLSAEGDGFAASARNLVLAGSDLNDQDFLLAPGTIKDTITVTANRGNARSSLDAPQTITITDASEIERGRPRSTLAAIEKTPNLNPIGSNPAVERPQLRGLASNRLLLLIDGERLNNFRSDPVSGISPGVIDVTELQSAEVVGGAGSSLYGSDALAGTINLVTKAPERTDSAQIFSIRLDSDLHSNGPFRRGATTINWSASKLALRLSGSLFATDDYRSGNQAVAVEEVVRLGQLAVEMGNLVNNNVARTYAVWRMPARAEIPNGDGHGFNDQADLWFFPSAKHVVRYRQLNSQHKNIEFPFITPPFDGRNQFNGFRRLDKYGLGYEGHDSVNWLPHLSAGFYRQRYSFSDDNFVSAIEPGSSWDFVPDSGGALSTLTGDASVFSLGSFTDAKNTVTSYGLNVQATLIPFSRAVVTTGFAYLRDYSRDQFGRVDFKSGTSVPDRIVSGRAGNPDSVYKNIGWFNLVEYEPVRWLRLIGGLRADKWKTEARVTAGFPLDTEATVLNASFDGLAANPGRINIDGLKGVADLVNAKSGTGTDNTVITGNVGVVIRAPGRINPYFRWANSYREPGITERYILRDFGDPTFSVLLVSNTVLKPERGNNYEAGLKVHRSKWAGSLAYFRNNLEDFLRPAFSDALFIPADPTRGLQPISPEFPFHGVLYVQRINTDRARIQGVEGSYEMNITLGRLGIIAPFATLGWLKGADLTPDANAAALIKKFYNRPDTAIPLKGSLNDVPLSAITPFRGIFGARYFSAGGKWFGQYQARYQARVERVDPLDLSSTILTQYGTLAGLRSFANQSVRGGFTYRRESNRISFICGVDNLADRFYFENFQSAPAQGRSFVFGLTMDFANLLKR